MKANQLDEGKTLLFEAAQNGPKEVKLKALGALGAVSYLTGETQLLEAVLAEGSQMVDSIEECGFMM